MPSGIPPPNPNSTSKPNPRRSGIKSKNNTQSQDQTSSTELRGEVTKPQLSRRKQSPRQSLPSDPDTTTLREPPATPPRAASDLEAATDKRSQKKSARAKHIKNATEADPGIATVPLPTSSFQNVPTQAPKPVRTNGFSTPNKPQTQAYAGPTFHASPAPSSLPIPKFFSKSLPANDDRPSLSAMIQEDKSEESSGKEDESPSRAASHRIRPTMEREVSPLDFFFKADREEKARKQSQASNSGLNTPQYLRASSVSPFRPDTGRSSPGAYFSTPFDMDPSDRPASRPPPNGRDPKPSPFDENPKSQNDEALCQAKAEALKRYLSNQEVNRSTSMDLSAVKSHPTYNHHDPSTRHPDETKTPTSRYHTRSVSAQLHNLSPSSTPSPNHTLSSSSNYPQSRPQSGSHLSQELKNDTIDDLVSTGSTSSSRNLQKVYQSSPSQNTRSRTSQLFTTDSTPQKFQPPSWKFSKEGPAQTTGMADDNEKRDSVTVMEDELRRILKLDLLSSDGATGVRS